MPGWSGVAFVGKFKGTGPRTILHYRKPPCCVGCGSLLVRH